MIDTIKAYLPQLVHGMKKSEKRFFKMFAATESGHVDAAVALFDKIEKSEPDKFSWNNYKEFNDYEIERLYHLTIKSLRHFYTQSKKEFIQKDEILDLRCLIDKAQYRQCRKMLTGLKSELYKEEEFSVLLKLLDIEKRLASFEDGSKLRFKPEIIAQEEEILIERERRILDLHDLDFRIRCAIHNKEVTIEQFLSEELLNQNNDILSAREQYQVWCSKERIYDYLNDLQKLNLAKDEIQKLIIKHPFLNAQLKQRDEA